MSDSIGCDVFSSLRGHAFDTGFDNNHQFVLLKLVTAKYLTLRLYYQNLRSRFGIERYAYTESHIAQIPCVCMYVCM